MPAPDRKLFWKSSEWAKKKNQEEENWATELNHDFESMFSMMMMLCMCVYGNISAEDVAWDSGSFISLKVFPLVSAFEDGKQLNRAETSEGDIHCSCKEWFNFFLVVARATRKLLLPNLFKTSPHDSKAFSTIERIKSKSKMS